MLAHALHVESNQEPAHVSRQVPGLHPSFLPKFTSVNVVLELIQLNTGTESLWELPLLGVLEDKEAKLVELEGPPLSVRVQVVPVERLARVVHDG